MSTRLYDGANATAAADGTAVFNFPPASLGYVNTFAVSVPTASPAATFTAMIGAQNWGVWNGPAPSQQLQGWGMEQVQVLAEGLLPGQVYGATRSGVVDLEEEAQPIVPSTSVPGFTQRLLGSFDLAGASGAFTVQGIQPSDAFLIFVPTGAIGVISAGTPTTVTGNAVNSVVINVPAGVADGDVLVLCVAESASASTTITDPPGWTPLDSTAGATAASPRLNTYVRVASSEPASYTINFTGTPRSMAGMVAYRGVDQVNPVDAHGANNTGATTGLPVVANSITTTSANDILLGFFVTEVATTFTADPAMAEIWDVPSTLITVEGATQSLGAAGATGTRTATAANAGARAAALVALRPGTTKIVGDPVLISAEGNTVSPLQVSATIGVTMVPSFQPASLPLISAIASSVTLNWRCGVKTRQLPTDIDVYASPQPLPDATQLFSVANLGNGSAAPGTFTLKGPNTAINIKTIAISVVGAADLEIWRSQPSAFPTNVASVIAGINGVAGAPSNLFVTVPEGAGYSGSDPTALGGDVLQAVVTGGTGFSAFELSVVYNDLGQV